MAGWAGQVLERDGAAGSDGGSWALSPVGPIVNGVTMRAESDDLAGDQVVTVGLLQGFSLVPGFMFQNTLTLTLTATDRDEYAHWWWMIGGWYRITWSMTGTGTAAFRVYLIFGDPGG
jgi:hypothetical protein